MQHDTDQRVPAMTARPDGRRLLPFRLEPLFRVACQFFQTLSLYQSAIPRISTSIKTAPHAHLRELTYPIGGRVSRRGRIVS